MKAAWPIAIPYEFIDGWHVRALCDHLEAVTEFDIKLLLANLPPRHTKSNIVSVTWPAWVWAKYPERRFIFITYNSGLAGRDAGRMRLILESQWYKGFWGKTVVLSDEKNTEKEFYNTRNGARFSTATDGRLTGEGGDYIVMDDPHNVKEAFSLTAMQTVEMIWTDALPSRVNDPNRSAKVVACQRVAPNDLSSVILRQNSPELVHLCLPALFDPERRCRTKLGFTDPRRTSGEALYPGLWNERALLTLKGDGTMSPFAWAAQYQQDPRAPGANVFTRALWRVWDEWDLPMMEQVIVGLDCAAKDGLENDYTACTVWGLFRPNPDRQDMAAMLLGGWKRKLLFPDLKPAVIDTIEEWTKKCWGNPPDWIFIEDKSAGIGLIQELQRAGIGPIQVYNPGQESKVQRAYTIHGLFSDGCVWFPGKRLPNKQRSDRFGEPFTEQVVEEFELFPRAPHDDLVDSGIPVLQFYRDRRFLSVSTDKEPDDEEADDRASEGRMRASPYG